MAIGSTIHNFEVALSDTSRNVYETLQICAARHSSETLPFLICRVLAFCLEFTERLEFSKGLDDPELPAIWARDLTGRITHWIEVGVPSVEKLHKASKKVEYVAVYVHKSPEAVIQQLAGRKIHHAEKIMLHAFSEPFLEQVSALTERRNNWQLSYSDGTIYLDTSGKNLVCVRESHPLA